MAVPSLKSIIAYGKKDGRTPEETAQAVQSWRKAALEEGRGLSGEDAQRYWDGSSQVEASAQAALTGLNELRRQKILTDIIRDPVEQKAFIEATTKGELPESAPKHWQDAATAILSAGSDPVFEGAKGFQGKISQGTNELGDYEIRQTPDGDYEALIQPSGGQAPVLKRFSADRGKMLIDSERELFKEREDALKYVDSVAKRDFSRDPQAEAAYREIGAADAEKQVQPLKDYAEFLKTSAEPNIVHTALTDALRTDEKFLKTVPENFLEQFVERQGRLLYASLENAATGISDLASGTTSSGEKAAARQAYIDEVAPGYLRSRFEMKGGPTISDAIGSGIQSMATLYGPGLALRGARLAAFGGAASESAGVAGLQAQIAQQGVATVGQQFRLGAMNYLTNPNTAAALGWTGMTTSAYGANYGAALQEADAVEKSDPERAARIRSMAQFSSFANAALETLTEKIFPDEANVFRGRGATLAGAAAIPLKEGVEEAAGAGAQNIIRSIFDTGQDEENLADAFKGGFYGGAPFAGVAALQGSLARQEPRIVEIPTESEVGGEVIAAVPTDTPFEEVERITNNIREGALRRQELEQIDPNSNLQTPAAAAAEEVIADEKVQNEPQQAQGNEEEIIDEQLQAEQVTDADLSALSSPETVSAPVREAESATLETAPDDSASSATSPEQLSNEPGSDGASGAVEEDPTLEPTGAGAESRVQKTDYIADMAAAQSALNVANREKGTNLEIIEAPAGKLADFAQQIASLSGRQVVYVKGKSDFDGVRYGNYLLVKPNSRQAIRKLVGHELAHSLEEAESVGPVLDILKQRYADKFASYKKQLTETLRYRESEVESEFFADAISEAINDRAFWRSLTQSTDPTTLQRIADALLTVVDKIVEFWNGQIMTDLQGRPNASRTLQNLTEARDKIREFIRSNSPAGEGGGQESRVNYTTKDRLQPMLDGPPQKLVDVKQEGHPLDGSTLMFPQEATDEDIQQGIADRTANLEGGQESRISPTQQFSVQTGFHEAVSQESLHKISDRIISPTKITETSYKEVLEVFKGLRRANGAVKTQIRKQVAEEFKDRLAKVPAKNGQRETEARILEAQAIQVLLGNAAFVAAEFHSRKGKQNPKRAATIISELKKLAFENITQVPGDAHTAARVLRSSQLEGGELAALMESLFDAASRFMEQKSGITPAAVGGVETAIEAARPEANRRAALKATPEGENYLAKEARQKGKLRKFFDKWILGKESRSQSPRERLTEAMNRLEEDYAGNIDQVMELAEEVTNNLPPEQREAALKELAELVEFDIRLAEEAYHLYNSARNLNRAVKSFVKKTTTPSRPRVKTQAAADLAAWRTAVREGRLSPEEAADLYVQEGGDPSQRADLIEAFATDANQTFQKEQLQEEARAARAEYRALLKEGNRRARVEAQSEEQLEPNSTTAATEESDQLIAEVGAETARQEDFVARVEQEAAEGAALEERQANAVFGRGKKSPSGAKTKPLAQEILDTIEANPEWDVSDHADKVQIIKEVLRRKGVAERLLDETAEKAVNEFDNHLIKIADKAAENLIKQIKRGKVTEAGLRKTVRLNILDPSKTLTESFAALSGWDGFTPQELSDLYKSTRTAGNVKDPQVRLSLLLKQMRLIYKATGIPPDWRDTVASATRSSAYSGAGTIIINAVVGPMQGFVINPIREMSKSLLTDPANPVKVIRDTLRSIVRSTQRGLRAGKLTLATGATVGLSPAAAAGGKADVGVLSVDALERRMDLALDRIKKSDFPVWRKAWESLMVVNTFGGKILWRVIGALDAFATTQLSEFIAEMRLNRNLHRQGLSGIREWTAFMEANESAVNHAVSELGLSTNASKLEALSRLQDAYYVELSGKSDVVPYQYSADARNEALSMIGNHAERQGLISRVGGWVADGFGHRNFLGLGMMLVGPIRTIAQIADYLSWYAPGISLGKILIEARKRKTKEGGAYNLHAGSTWQWKRRVHESVFGHMLFGGILALLAAQPDDDDEKWLGITTSYPWSPEDRLKFKNNRETEFTLYFGRKSEGRKYIQFTRGVLEMLAFPAVAAKNIDDVRRGKMTALEGSARMMWDMTNLSAPLVNSLAKQVNLMAQGNNDRLMEDLAKKASLFLPLSAATRTAQKLTQDAPAKNSENYLASLFIPGYALYSGAGDVELRNALDEPVFTDKSVWGKLAKAGLPFGYLPATAPQDPLLAADFPRMNYGIPPAPPFKTFMKGIEGREEELWEANEVTTNNDLYNKWITNRAAAFKRIYREDSDPGENAKDPRTLDEIKEAKDQKAYKARLSTLWSKATRETNQLMQIKE